MEHHNGTHWSWRFAFAPDRFHDPATRTEAEAFLLKHTKVSAEIAKSLSRCCSSRMSVAAMGAPWTATVEPCAATTCRGCQLCAGKNLFFGIDAAFGTLRVLGDAGRAARVKQNAWLPASVAN